MLSHTRVSGQKVNVDSAKRARQQQLDATRAVQKRVLDSTRLARQHFTDSLKTARKRSTDSIAAARKYKESKRYKDSIAASRQERVDSARTVRTAYNDSVRTVRQRSIDSVNAIRKLTTDKQKAIQKQRADSLASIRKYKESKRYKDSVAVTRQHRTDSTRTARKIYSDSVSNARRQTLEAAAAIRKQRNDSLLSARKKVTDSVTAARKVKADSLAKVKDSKEKLRKSQEKTRTDKMNLALELKIKKKRQAWNNEKMLKKKWGLPRKVIQNTVTRYNYYFNADRKMDEAIANMLRMRKENYDEIIPLFPFDPDKDSTALAPDMDSIIQKTSLGIQIHDPRTKWADDLYLLLGQAYYYKANYVQAGNAFRYIISINQQRKAKEQKEAGVRKGQERDMSIVEKDDKSTLDFLKHKSANNDAILWLARTYTEAHKESEAESILDLLESDKNLPEYQKGRVALEKAYLNLSRNNYKSATPHLTIVADDEELPEWIRIRAAYLNGQLLYQLGDYTASAAHFQRVVDLQPKIEQEFYARKYIAYSLMEGGGTQDEAMASLKKMLKDGKYATYYEQVYYVLGRLSANGSNYDDAVTYLQKSISSSKSTKKQKALSFASLGNVQYVRGNYKAAGLAYDSAAYLSKYAPDDTMVLAAVKRGKVLDNVSRPVEEIKVQDSLLALAALSDKDQRAVVRRYIRMLEQQKADSTSRAENGDAGKDVPDDAEPVPSGSGYANWYFSNPVLMKQGVNDFKRKWGNRPNTDNWRLSGMGSAVAKGNSTADELSAEEAAAAGLDENGLPTEQSLLAAIPTTTERQGLSRQRIQKAYINLANAYVKDLGDYPNGLQTLDTLDKRFAVNDHQGEALYLRYLIALRQNELSLAQRLSERIRSEYGNTEWAKKVAPPEEPRGLLASNNNIPVSSYYDETYGLMMQRDYVNVLQRVREGQKQYKDPVYLNRFRIMEAIALVGSGDYNRADTLLTEFISTHPTDSLRSWAETVMDYARKNKPVVIPPAVVDTTTAGKGAPSVPPSPSGLSPTPGMPAPPMIPGEGSPDVTPPPAVYSFNAKEEHYFVFYFYKAESRSMGVKAGLNDFNTFNYSSQKLTSAMQMLQEKQGVIIVKSFPSASHAKIYMNAVRSNNLLLKEYRPEDYQLMVISASNYKKLTADKDILPYVKFYKNSYK